MTALGRATRPGVAAATLAYFEGLAKEGRIHGHREYFCLTGNSSQRAGFMIVDGELEELQRIQLDDENLRLMAEASSIVESFEVTLCAGGSDQALGENVTRFTETMSAMGYM
ncbi:MAG: hypothetical protein M3279_01300 [Actinomycetota bacterium]|nr:hypothetical protein [Actinomycetota bacterium]